MLTIEIKVNGNLVAAISAANTTALLAGDRTPVHTYTAQAVEFRQYITNADLLDMVPKRAALYVDHVREEGILKLECMGCHARPRGRR
jgi:hypothetical protein